jgi:hypothetical protein
MTKPPTKPPKASRPTNPITSTAIILLFSFHRYPATGALRPCGRPAGKISP